jgi:glycosyltransferase involved in cell wall biosynthesis
MTGSNRYVLITPTRDEEKTIGRTIASVVSQTILPVEWLIVNDGSTDGTEALVENARLDHPWIRLIQLPPRAERCFGAVAKATKIAVENLTITDYGYIGLLDSDVEFSPIYFESVIREFEANSRLGLAGGWVLDADENPNIPPDNLRDVPGAVQFFRRDCFESLSGIHVIPEGGWDMLTCAEARMNGYETVLLTSLKVDHLKPRNIAYGGIFSRRWQYGIRDYVLGYHPLFETVKCIGRLREPPLVISAACWWMGYMSAAITRKERRIPSDLLAHIRSEQLLRLKFLRRTFPGKTL